MTSAVNIALGNWVFPHLFQMCYSAQSATAIRRNAVWQPLYSLAYFFIILLGFAALLAGVQPPDNNLNAALLQFVATSYPAWVIGLVAGTGFLLALVPGSLLLLSAGTIFTRNIAQPICGALSEAASLRLSRAALVCFAALAAFLSISDGSSWCASCSMLTRRSACWRRRCSWDSCGGARRHTACWPGWWRVSSPCWRRSRPAIGPAPCPNGSRD